MAVSDLRAPEISLIVETNGPVVGHALGEARSDEAMVQLLRKAMEDPLDGPPRRPSVVRVAEASIAEAIQAAGLGVVVVVGPTPAVDDAIAAMSEVIARDGPVPTYLEEGRTERSVRDLFVAAKSLWSAAPWSVLTDDDIFRVDIPALGVRGACLSVLGHQAQSHGFLLFESDEAFDAFRVAAEREMRRGARRRRHRQIDLGSDFLSLEFEPGAELQLPLREEIARHAWPATEDAMYPMAEMHLRNGETSFASEAELQVLTAVSFALGAFFFRHSREIEDPEATLSESITTGDGPTVTLTLPYDAADAFEPPRTVHSVAAATKVSRNDPCPCGSGKKYKKCHLDEDDRVRRAELAEPDRLPPAYSFLLRDIGLFAASRYGESWGDQISKMMPDGLDTDAQLAVPWMAFGACVDGTPIAARFLETRGSALSRVQRSLIEAELAAWLSIWRIVETDQSATLVLEDLLTGERRRVADRTASVSLRPGQCCLGRIMDYDGASFFSGAHGIALSSGAAEAVAARIRKKVRRKGTVATDTLRDARLAPFMLRAWREVAREETFGPPG